MWTVDESYRTLAQTNGIEARLLKWREMVVKRNLLICEAGRAGLTPYRIGLLTGLSRQTVRRILDGDPRAQRQAPR